MQKDVRRRWNGDDGVGGRGGGRGLGRGLSRGRFEDADPRESTTNVINAGVPGFVIKGAARGRQLSASAVPRPRAETTEGRAVLCRQLLRLRVDEAAAGAGDLVFLHIFLFIILARLALPCLLALDPFA